MLQHVEQPFLPVFNHDSSILILGSFPSVRSRSEGFYYGHPQNRFWRMLAAVYHEAIPQTISDKTTLLLNHQLALWDVIESCDIEGSSDASICHVIAADLPSLLPQTRIEHIVCNGMTAGKLYRRYLFPDLKIEAQILPSTSPANAAWSLDRLIEIWSNALHP